MCRLQLLSVTGMGCHFLWVIDRKSACFLEKKRLKFEMSRQAEVLFVLLVELEIEGAMDELSRE